MGLIGLLISDPLLFLAIAVPLLYSIIAHEVAHGWVASLFGDDTARRMGRLSLNPLDHLDPMGTLALLIVGFGWAKPVPVDFRWLKPHRAGVICVSLAGCLANLLIATAAVFLLQFDAVVSSRPLAIGLSVVARINVILCGFNLLPIPPLDGSRILMVFLPSELRRAYASIERYGLIILMVLLFTGMLDPLIIFMQKAIFTIIALALSLVR